MTSQTHASVLINIGANLGQSFNQSFGGANKQLNKLGKTVKQFDGNLKSIDGFKQSKQATLEAGQAWRKAQNEFEALSNELTKGEKRTKAFNARLYKAQKNASIARERFAQTRHATENLGQSLKKAGIDTQNLSKAQLRLGNSLKRVKKQQASLNKTLNAKQANLAKRSHYRSQLFDVVALGGALYGAIRPAVQFEQAMAKVGSITGVTANSQNFKLLTAQARELGRTTQYTASQTAEAMKYLAMTGMKTNDILEATPAVLNMAIAADMELGKAADIASNILTGFNMKAERTAEVADVLAQAARTTNVNIEMLGQTMKYVAPAAASVGGSLQDTAALAGVLGDAGIQATMAGTMLRSTYLRLAAPANAGSKALNKMRGEMGITAEEMPDVAKEALLAQKQLSDMGVAIFDKNGNMRSMVDIMKDINQAMKGMSDEKRLKAVKDIFGMRASTGALAIFKSIDTGRLDDVIDKINHSDGAAKEMADRLKNTTLGAFKQFSSAMESVGISIGSVLLPAFAKVALVGAKVAGGISLMADKFPLVTKVIGLAIAALISFKVTAVATGFVWTFIKGGCISAKDSIVKFYNALVWMKLKMKSVKFKSLVSGVLSFGKSLWRVALGAIPAMIGGIRAMSVALVTTPLGLIIAGIAAGAALIIHYWKPISAFFGKLFSPVIPIFKNVLGWINKLWEKAKHIFDSIKKWVSESFIGKTWRVVVGTEDKDSQSANKTMVTNASPHLGHVANEMMGSGHRVNTDSNVISFPAQTANANNTHHDNTTINIDAPITIHATPGMSEQDIAHAVKVEFDKIMREAKQRKMAANYD